MTVLASPFRQLVKGASVSNKRTREDRFWAKVDVRGPDECWEWQAATFRKGYGMFWLGDGCRHLTGAHRYSYAQAFGPIKQTDFVCHHCDNPPCVNPAHLFVGTRVDNMQDMMRKGRHWVQTGAADMRGEGNGRAKVTWEQVREIRARAASGETHTAIARDYPINRSSVSHIITGRKWPEPGESTEQVLEGA